MYHSHKTPRTRERVRVKEVSFNRYFEGSKAQPQFPSAIFAKYCEIHAVTLSFARYIGLRLQRAGGQPFSPYLPVVSSTQHVFRFRS